MAVAGEGKRQQLDVGAGLGGSRGALWNFPRAAGQVKLFFIPMTTSPSCPLLDSSCLGARAAGSLFTWRMWLHEPLRCVSAQCWAHCMSPRQRFYSSLKRVCETRSEPQGRYGIDARLDHTVLRLAQRD